MKALPLLLLAAACAALPAFAQDEHVTSSHLSTVPGAGIATQTVRMSAQIVALDPATRSITLKQRNGQVTELKAGDRVRNFNQLKVGDIVNAVFEDTLQITLKKGQAGITERIESGSSSSAQPGQAPGGTAQREVTVLADVVSVNTKEQRVKLRGPGGNFDVRLQDPEQLKLVKKGDQVEIVYKQEVAVQVEPQPNAQSR